MMDSLSVRAVLKVMEPPMALRVLMREKMRTGRLKKGDIARVTVEKVGRTANVGGGVLFKYAHTHISVTASPTPQNFASSSIPSSRMTVLSTSKHTASALRKSSFVSKRVAIVLET